MLHYVCAYLNMQYLIFFILSTTNFVDREQEYSRQKKIVYRSKNIVRFYNGSSRCAFFSDQFTIRSDLVEKVWLICNYHFASTTILSKMSIKSMHKKAEQMNIKSTRFFYTDPIPNDFPSLIIQRGSKYECHLGEDEARNGKSIKFEKHTYCGL